VTPRDDSAGTVPEELNKAGNLINGEQNTHETLQLQPNRVQNAPKALQLQPNGEEDTRKNSIAMCVSIKDENEEDLTEWIQYYRCR
jgi:hypothetical protein